jgi:hypothetical protein
MWKHLTLFVATILGFGASLMMMQRVIGPASPWMGLMLMLCLLGLAKVAEPLYRLQVPGGLRQIHAWELRGDLYRSLAVPEFGALLRNTPLRLLNTSVYVLGRRRDLALVVSQVEAAEASHLWATLVLVPYLVIAARSRSWAVVAGLLLVEIVGNAYPIMHLRMVRGRLSRLALRRSPCAAPPPGAS